MSSFPVVPRMVGGRFFPNEPQPPAWPAPLVGLLTVALAEALWPRRRSGLLRQALRGQKTRGDRGGFPGPGERCPLGRASVVVSFKRSLQDTLAYNSTAACAPCVSFALLAAAVRMPDFSPADRVPAASAFPLDPALGKGPNGFRRPAAPSSYSPKSGVRRALAGAARRFPSILTLAPERYLCRLGARCHGTDCAP